MRVHDWQAGFDVLAMAFLGVGASVAICWAISLTPSAFAWLCRHRRTIPRRAENGQMFQECVNCGLLIADIRDHRVGWHGGPDAA